MAGKLVRITTYASLEEAEAAGEQLIGRSIDVQIKGAVLWVDEADAERAVEILQLPSEPFPEEPKRLHRCPQCGVGDPLWYGKRKAILLAAIVVLLLMLRRSDLIVIAVLMALFLFVIAARYIPEFQCRQCGHRWTRERR